MEAEGEEDAPAGTAEAMAPVAAGCDEELARLLQEQEEQALEESRRQQQAEDAIWHRHWSLLNLSPRALEPTSGVSHPLFSGLLRRSARNSPST